MFATLPIIIVLIGFVEGSGIPWPGALLLTAYAMLYAGRWPVLALLTVLFTLGYLLGALAQYFLGRQFGAKALGWLPEKIRGKLEAAINRYGPGLTLWGRFTLIGNYVSLPAGHTQMPILTFSIYTFVGTLPWAIYRVLLGTALGTWLKGLAGLLDDWLIPALIVVLVAGLVSLAWPRLRKSD